MGQVTHNGTVIAQSIWEPSGIIDEMRGLRFRASMADIGSVVFGADGELDLGVVDTAFVFFPIDVVWVEDGQVEKVTSMGPFNVEWCPRADTIVELPSGRADGIGPGDTVRVHR